MIIAQVPARAGMLHRAFRCLPANHLGTVGNATVSRLTQPSRLSRQRLWQIGGAEPETAVDPPPGLIGKVERADTEPAGSAGHLSPSTVVVAAGLGDMSDLCSPRSQARPERRVVQSRCARELVQHTEISSGVRAAPWSSLMLYWFLTEGFRPTTLLPSKGAKSCAAPRRGHSISVERSA